METTDRSTSDAVLHITAHRNPADAHVAAELAGAGLRVEGRPDPYTALALLAKPETPPFVAVVVSVDGWFEKELDFFRVVRRLHRSLELHVYVDTDHGDQRARALESGATAWNEEALERLIQRVPNLAAAGSIRRDERARPDLPEELEVLRVVPAVPPPHDDADEHGVVEVPETPPQQPADPDDTGPDVAPPAAPRAVSNPEKPQQPAQTEGPKPANSTRVPWRAYEDRPLRKPPGAVERVAPPASEPPGPVPPDEPSPAVDEAGTRPKTFLRGTSEPTPTRDVSSQGTEASPPEEEAQTIFQRIPASEQPDQPGAGQTVPFLDRPGPEPADETLGARIEDQKAGFPPGDDLDAGPLLSDEEYQALIGDDEAIPDEDETPPNQP